MPRYIAFLRAINVGGRVVKMERLREIFEELRLTNVESFIASGNVIFESRTSEATLARKIEGHLHKTLAYQVDTFLRSEAEIAAIAAHEAFPPAELNTTGTTLFIGFLNAPPTAGAQQKLLSFPSPTDSFHFHGRELYWLCRTRASDSPFTGARLEKLLGMRTTIRNVNTVRRLALKDPAP
jgi:uncharacterized protein (DUF1697 family)